MKENLINNFGSSFCKHNVKWIPEKTLSVRRDGYGNATKTILEKCVSCNKLRKRDIRFTDIRVDYGVPYMNSKGDIFKNSIKKDYKKDEQEHYRIFN